MYFGGLALKNTLTRRYTRQEFDDASADLLVILRQSFDMVEIPLFYSSKESFGDIDIILSMDGFDNKMDDYINETFMPNEIFHNGNCWSFDYKEVQVDLITCSSKNFEANYHYLSFNDLGNMMGRITQKLGLKYGQEGLWYNHYFKEGKAKIAVSQNFPKIFEFLGFDYKRWQEGFETLEDIFDYVATSPYFDADMFGLEHLNKINRERNAKRKSYMSFLDHIKENHSDRKFEYDDKVIYIEMVNKFFPEARMEMNIREFEYKVCRDRYIKSKFSGGEIARRYGLKGKGVGDALKGFYMWVSIHIGLDYDEYIMNEPVDNIYGEFEKYYKEYVK
jgi:hypothetical protein